MSNERTIEAIDWHGEDGASLRLENGHVSGSGGINRLMGNYELAGELLSFGAIATTMMAGSPDRMKSEQLFLANLGRVARWSITDTERLLFSDEGGTEILSLHRATEDPPSASSTGLAPPAD